MNADQRALNHPFHIHGYPFHVMGMGQIPANLTMTRQLARLLFHSNKLDTKPFLQKAPLKDTVSIPSSGYTIVRFRANNPGNRFEIPFFTLIIVKIFDKSLLRLLVVPLSLRMAHVRRHGNGGTSWRNFGHGQSSRWLPKMR